MLIRPAYSVTKPSVPEFTLKYVDHSYDIQPTYGIDQYTGKSVITHQGEHVDNRTVEFTIKNQPFNSYNDSSGNYISLYYNFRYKGSYGGDWDYYPFNGTQTTHSFGPYGGGHFIYYSASSSDYTVISISLTLLTSFPGDWSSTQTITVGDSASTTSPTALPSSVSPTPTASALPSQNPSASPVKTDTQRGVVFGFSWEQTAIVVLVVLVAVLFVVVGVLLRKRNTK